MKRAIDKIRALVVDDKKITGDLFGFILGNGIHDVKVVQSADEAIFCVKTQDFDVVFLDVIMPEKDGVEALEGIKQIKPNLPVIMMSGYTAEEKRNRMRAIGITACLEKPVEMGKVRSIVREALGKEI